MRTSIRTRLIVWVSALLLPLSIGAGWLLAEVFGNRLLHDIDVALQEEAETVAELAATPRGPGSVTELISEISAETDSGPRKFVTLSRAGEVIAEAPAGARKVLQAADPTLRVVRYHAPHSDLTVSVGVSAAAALHAKRRLTSLLAVSVPLSLLLLGTGIWLIIGRALRPLQDATQRLEAVAAETLSVRVPVENPEDEVGRMVTVLNRMLERLERAVGELQRFTADAAHELRTPLAVLRTGLEVALSRDRPAADYSAALTEALESTNRLGRLAADLLTLARLDAAGAPRADVPVDLYEVLQELADAAESLATPRRLRVEVDATPGLWVRGDAGDLYRLFNNLIENALRHSDPGGTVQLSAQRLGAALQVRVADCGAGIAAEELPRVFDRFFRGNSTTKGVAGEDASTGLGLSIAREIARTHGGEIAAMNQAGGGCLFTVTLPADRAHS